jgi:hypothetical protein
VGLRRGDGDRERGRERFGGKMVWGREIDIEDGDGFSKSEFSFNFFFLKKKTLKLKMALST